MTELAYDYRSVCRIMEANGYNDEEIKEFLIANQNAVGYIMASKIPKIKK